MFNTLLVNPIFNLLVWLYNIFGNLGWAIIALTVISKLVLLPLTLPSIKIARKQQELSPEIAKLKERYKDNKMELAKAQTAFLQEHGIYPALGCLPQIISFLVLIALYQSLNLVLKLTPESLAEFNRRLYVPSWYLSTDSLISTSFFYLNLTTKDPFYILPVVSAAFQFLLSKLMMPDSKKFSQQAQKTEGKTDDLAAAMQQQSLYMAPLMTLFLGFSLPSGLTLYWFLTTLLSLVQYRFFWGGWGGLSGWIESASKINLRKRLNFFNK